MRSVSRLSIGAILGAVAGVIASFFTIWQASVLLGWCTTAAVFLSTLWMEIHGFSANDTRAKARREDPSIPTAELMLIAASLACLVGVAFDMYEAAAKSGATEAFLVILGVVSVMISWTLTHTLFMLHYARLYYDDSKASIDFNGDEEPTYVDFAYVAFTIGMTFQVSDTELQASSIRRTALHQALVSYVFGTVVVAMTINIVAGLFR